MPFNIDGRKDKSGNITEDVTVLFNPNHMRPGEPMNIPLIPAEIYPRIGMVAVHWGDYELLSDTILSCLASAFPMPEADGWRGRSFNKRNNLLMKKAREAFGDHEKIVDLFSYCTDYASDLQWPRNLIVHGQYFLGPEKANAASFELSPNLGDGLKDQAAAWA